MRFEAIGLHWRNLRISFCSGSGPGFLTGWDAAAPRQRSILIDTLHHYFTEEPQAALPAGPETIEPRLEAGIRRILEPGNVGLNNFILGRLAEIALADGSLLGKEGAVILEIGERLGFDSAPTYRIMVAAADQAGVQANTRFNRAALALRRSLGMDPCG